MPPSVFDLAIIIIIIIEYNKSYYQLWLYQYYCMFTPPEL